MRLRSLLAALLALVLIGACASEPDGGAGPGASPDASSELIVQAANYELVAGEDSRFIAGALTPDQLFVSYGTVQIDFFYLGTRRGEGTGEEGPSATGTFLPIEGSAEGPSGNTPVAVPGSRGRGVYAAEVTFDRPGFWEAEVTAELEDGARTGRAAFEVYEEHRYPAVGEKAPRTENLTLTSDAPREAIDSRARGGEKIPDPELHRMTITESIRRKEPVVVVFATPVYCVSRFCGPITDMVSELQADYADRANFIHVEVWRDFEDTVVNKGAAEWIYRNENLTEPWVYLIGADGIIAARWDNVATRGEIEPLLKELPRLP